MAENKSQYTKNHEALLEKLKAMPNVKAGPYEIIFEADVLEDSFIEKARDELRETPENVEAGLKRIRELIRDEPDLVVPDEDAHLQKFLRPCKWYPDSAFKLMKRFYRFNLNYSRVTKDLLPSKEKSAFCSGILLPLPFRADDGSRVFLIQGGSRWKPKEVGLYELFRAVMMFVIAAMAEPQTQIAGVTVIIDMDGLTLHHVTYFTPSFAAMVVEWVQRCLPCRLKGIHIINQPFIFNMIFAMFKPFLHDKLRKRIHFHGSNMTNLNKILGSKCLPEAYGGELKLSLEPIGEPLWKYYSIFDDDFKEINQWGYVSKT